MPRHPPLLGMRRQQGRDSGEMECWETRADRLPAGERLSVSLLDIYLMVRLGM